MTYAYVGLGGNTGKPKRQLKTAKRLLARLPAAKLTGISPLYVSEPVGCPGRQNLYYNAVAELQTTRPPQRLFASLRQTERAVQRRRRLSHAPRRLDVDYLIHGRAVLRNRHLTLPHPRMTQRAFVLRPLVDVLVGNARQPALILHARQSLMACQGQVLRRL